MTREENVRRIGASLYFLTQGLGIISWWIILIYIPTSRVYFRTSRMSDEALLDFIWPDLFFLGFGSVLCSWMIWKHHTAPITKPLIWMMVGAAIYPTLYVCGATYMSDGEGWAASMAMLLCASGSFFAAWTAQLENPLFRVAPQRSDNQHIFRTFIQTSIFWFLSLVAVPWLLTKAEQTLGISRFHTLFQPWLPWVLFAIIGTINLYTGYTMSNWGKGTPLPLETARVLVVRGPYRYVRNPMAITGLSLGLMVGWWLGSWFTLAIVFAGGLVWHIFVRPIEERDLEDRFGEEYLQYKKQVRNWIPTARPAPPAP